MRSLSQRMAEVLCTMQGMKLMEMRARLESEFPEATQDEVARAFSIALDEVTERAKRHSDEANALRSLVKSRQAGSVTQ